MIEIQIQCFSKENKMITFITVNSLKQMIDVLLLQLYFSLFYFKRIIKSVRSLAKRSGSSQ